jgi:hypothetical protein
MVIAEAIVSTTASPEVVQQPRPRVSDRTASARLLEYERGHWVALPLHTTIEVLESPKIVDVPGTVDYCHALSSWRGQWLPVLDLQTWASAHVQEASVCARHLLVVAYQVAAFAPICHGAINLPFFLETVEVSDTAQCPLPTDSDVWLRVASSCFKHDGHVVPILDTGRLFSKP